MCIKLANTPQLQSPAMITHLYRYPIKGLTGEALDQLDLIAGEGILGDRAIAISRKAGTFDMAAPVAQPKSKFLMLAKDEALAALQTRFDTDTDTLTIAQDGAELLTASISDEAGRTDIAHFFKSYLADDTLTPEIARADGHKFTDVSVVSAQVMRSVSIINLASIRALEEAVSQSIDPRRFRANIYFDGLPAWAELDWPGENVQIGNVDAKALFRTRRCPATQVNPDSAKRDIDIPAELTRHFGDADMGIYVEITSTGTVRPGDKINLKTP